ncbi:unnamed protein product, partial [Larinioides sclopetarius]
MEFFRVVMHLSMRQDLSNHSLMNKRMKLNIYLDPHIHL